MVRRKKISNLMVWQQPIAHHPRSSGSTSAPALPPPASPEESMVLDEGSSGLQRTSSSDENFPQDSDNNYPMGDYDEHTSNSQSAEGEEAEVAADMDIENNTDADAEDSEIEEFFNEEAMDASEDEQQVPFSLYTADLNDDNNSDADDKEEADTIDKGNTKRRDYMLSSPLLPPRLLT
ncbi:hypothetical protein N431DRAFT_473716 [Stipitochalara longipes BDJ]|nr:hypothetical protein N431DRAFT_473716 [Stipitochalara longipes BDJ]